MKLVTGVEISTRAVNRSGRPGKPVYNSSRTAAAAPKRVAFLLSIFIVADVHWWTRSESSTGLEVPELRILLILEHTPESSEPMNCR